MKIFTPRHAREGVISDELPSEIIKRAYRQLMHENMDKPIKGEVSFSQGALIGRIRRLGYDFNEVSSCAAYLNQEDYFRSYWIIVTQPDFYRKFNSHSIIRFFEKP